MKPPPLVELERLLLREEGFVIRLRQTRLGQQLSSVRRELLTLVREVTRSGNLPLIIAIELEIIRGDLLRYANSRGMVNSLKLAEEELQAVQRHLELVGNPASYAFINQGHSLRKKRDHGLPLDDARTALASHHARLQNMDKSRLDEDEKQFVEARKAAMSAAIKCYAALQTAALSSNKV